jgi:hypothetical protein
MGKRALKSRLWGVDSVWCYEWTEEKVPDGSLVTVGFSFFFAVQSVLSFLKFFLSEADADAGTLRFFVNGNLVTKGISCIDVPLHLGVCSVCCVCAVFVYNMVGAALVYGMVWCVCVCVCLCARVCVCVEHAVCCACVQHGVCCLCVYSIVCVVCVCAEWCMLCACVCSMMCVVCSMMCVVCVCVQCSMVFVLCVCVCVEHGVYFVLFSFSFSFFFFLISFFSVCFFKVSVSSGKTTFTSLSFRRLPAATPSSVTCRFYKCIRG